MFPFDANEDEEWDEPDASEIASIIFLRTPKPLWQNIKAEKSPLTVRSEHLAARRSRLSM
jgi:hypothetical protein